MILAEYGALGGSNRDAARNIALNIFDFLGGSDGNLPESFSLGDENNNLLISAALLGSSRNDLIDPPSDSNGEKESWIQLTRKSKPTRFIKSTGIMSLVWLERM